jgi:hypothetical protein
MELLLHNQVRLPLNARPVPMTAATSQTIGVQRQQQSCTSFRVVFKLVLIQLYHSWLYTLYVAMDANFRLKLRDRQIKNDPELGPGWAYCVNEKSYQEEMEQYGDQTEVFVLYSILIIANNCYRLATASPTSMPSTTPIHDSLKTVLRMGWEMLYVLDIPLSERLAPRT